MPPLDPPPGDWCRSALQTEQTHTPALHVYVFRAFLLPVHWSSLQVLPVNMTPGFFSLLQTLERQKMSVDSMKRPLMMAALNGLYVARMPVPESPAEDGAKASTDERVRLLISSTSSTVSIKAPQVVSFRFIL